jgi:hypothetical protein
MYPWSAMGQSRPESATAAPLPAESKLRSLAEKLSKAEGDAEELKSDRFAVRQYPSPDAVRSGADGEDAKPLAWYPLLIAAPDGRVTIPAVAPAAAGTIYPWSAARLIIDAHSDGRIESCELPAK